MPFKITLDYATNIPSVETISTDGMADNISDPTKSIYYAANQSELSELVHSEIYEWERQFDVFAMMGVSSTSIEYQKASCALDMWIRVREGGWANN